MKTIQERELKVHNYENNLFYKSSIIPIFMILLCTILTLLIHQPMRPYDTNQHITYK